MGAWNLPSPMAFCSCFTETLRELLLFFPRKHSEFFSSHGNASGLLSLVLLKHSMFFLLVPGKCSLWWHELYMGRHELYMGRHELYMGWHELYMWRHKLCGYICKRRIYIKRKGCHPTALPESSFEAYEKLLEFTRDPLGARTQDPHIKSVMLYQLS